MAKKVHNIPRDNNILRIPLEEAMPDNYLPYAVEVAKENKLVNQGDIVVITSGVPLGTSGTTNMMKVQTVE